MSDATMAALASSPVLDASTSSRVQFAIQPLGLVPFDGQVLPRVSPDGRFVATQVGQAPTWETLLARPGAEVPQTSVAVYSIGGLSPKLLSESGESLAGLLLGRSAIDEGVLVEAPQPDGSRWIGVLPWIAIEPRWIVQGNGVNAHAIMRDDGVLVHIRRAVDDRRSSLVVRTRAGIESTWYEDAIEPLAALPCADESLVAFLARTGAGLEAITLRVNLDGDRPRFGAIVARGLLAPEATEIEAYQSATTAQSSRLESLDGSRIMLFYPAAGRVAIFDPRTARLRTLPEGSIAATTAPGGFLVATSDDLRFVPESAIEAPAKKRLRMSARVWDRPAIAHSTERADAPFIVMSPSPTGGQIQLFRLSFDVAG